MPRENNENVKLWFKKHVFLKKYQKFKNHGYVSSWQKNKIARHV
jgi:hypothetical protein